MKNEPVAGVQHEILRWARLTVGLSVAEVAHTLKRTPEEIEAWETGSASPTYVQLEKLAYQLYKRPLAVFFLPSPPEETLPQREFRTLPDADMQSLSRDTCLHIRRAHAYQLALMDLFNGHNPATHRIWKTLTLSPNDTLADQARDIRAGLGVTLEIQLAWGDDDQALKAWRTAIEEAGIFVFKAAFKQKEISGFCLTDENLPIIYLNNSTTKTRQIFSLLHELAHLLLGMKGLSKFDAAYADLLPLREREVERFCNAIAAEVLMPEADFSAQVRQFPDNAEQASDEQVPPSPIATASAGRQFSVAFSTKGA
jgi:Zn-dependent peptidase ImmA (M78 family)/transcriptional regulator with XRE-family HTH domain